MKTDGNETLLLSIPNTAVLKTLATTSYALLVFYVLHVASPRIHEANYFIISHVACKYTWLYKKHSSFSFITLFFMPRLSEHERSDAIEKWKAICQLYSASGIVTRLLGQLKIVTGLISQKWRLALRANLHRLSIDDIYFDDIHSSRLLSVPEE